MCSAFSMLRSGLSAHDRASKRPESGRFSAPEKTPYAGANDRSGVGGGEMLRPTKVVALRPRFSVVETLDIGVARWLTHHVDRRCKPTTQASYRYALGKLQEAHGNRPLDDLTQIEVLATLHRLPDASHSTLWTAWAACLNWLGRYDITRRVKRPKSRRRRAVLDVATLPHWIGALALAQQETWVRRQTLDVLLVGTLVPMRKGEIVSLRWSELDLGNAIAELSDSKTGPRKVPLGRLGASLIASQPRRSEYVFASRLKTPSMPHITGSAVSQGFRKIITRYAEKTGHRWPPALCFHSLRHTWTSHAKACGVSTANLQQICGWSSAWIADRYTHLVDEIREDVNRVQSRLVAGLQLQMTLATS